MNIAITAHRPKDLGNEYDLHGPYSDYIRKEVQKIIDIYHPEYMFNGLAEGGDQLTLLVALENNIKVYGCIPFEGQENKWSGESKERYKMLLAHPLVTVINVSGQRVERTTPYWQIANWMQKRNEYMVDRLFPPNDMLVPIWNGKTEKSGTYNCIKYARKRLPESNFIYIDPRKALL